MGCRIAAGPERWSVPLSFCCDLLSGVDRLATGSTRLRPKVDCFPVSGRKGSTRGLWCRRGRTGYVTWISGREKSDSPWLKPETRVEHKTDLAMRQMLTNALDVEGLRLHFGEGPETLSAEGPLVAIDRARAKSRHVLLLAPEENQQ